MILDQPQEKPTTFNEFAGKVKLVLLLLIGLSLIQTLLVVFPPFLLLGDLLENQSLSLKNLISGSSAIINVIFGLVMLALLRNNKAAIPVALLCMIKPIAGSIFFLLAAFKRQD